MHVKSFSVSAFFRNSKELFAAALGIEILCIASAEVGENLGLYAFGFNPVGIAAAYAAGYALAGFTTFLTILGRGNHGSCCSVLEHESSGFLSGLKGTLTDFASGIRKIAVLHKQPNLKGLLKSSLIILVTAESACIITAETVDLLLYQYSVLLSIPLALIAGAFAIVVPQAVKKSRG